MKERVRVSLVTCILALVAWSCAAPTEAAQTLYTLPQDVHWTPITDSGAPPGAYTATLRGKASDKCGQLFRMKFPDGYVYPWHVNNLYGIYTVLKGTLVLGFDKNHSKAAERALPTGSVVQGLKTEPHYGRAIGETIFDVYILCDAR